MIKALTDTSTRDAVEARATWKSNTTDGFVGLAHLADTLADGSSGASTVLTGRGNAAPIRQQTLKLSGQPVCLGSTELH